MTWLVAGLGNPGPSYARTRHNAGAMVVEAMADAAGERFRKRRFLPVEIAEIRDADSGEALVLARPTTFMNLCGPPLASLAKKVRVGVDRVIACHDDIDLPFGVLQVKQGGSTAGHQGLNSMVQAFGSKDFYRVRLGVGRPPGRQDPADYVLELFAPRERDEVAVLVQEAADAVRTIIREGLAAAQDRFNGRRA